MHPIIRRFAANLAPSGRADLAAAPIPESARRLPGFREGEPIVLGDGQPWHFPKPILEFRLIFKGGQPSVRDRVRFGDGHLRDFGDDYWQKWSAFESAAENAETINALAVLAVDLLRRNYSLSDDEIVRLLPFHFDQQGEPGEANAAMWRAVMGVARGIGKKASVDGSGSLASSPTPATA